jgi:outer membrane protein assembly factor BamA
MMMKQLSKVIMVALMFLPLCAVGQNAHDSALVREEGSQLELFPILSYDSDAGFGFGGKAFAWNFLRGDESIDLTLFRSTKGERWYRLVVSLPDFERRQGTVYPWSLDAVVDYDKWIASNFFGVGKGSRSEDRVTYTKEPLELTLMAGRGFTPTVAGQAGIRFKAVRTLFDSHDPSVRVMGSLAQSGRVAYLSMIWSIRYDTRDSYVDATHGLVVQGDIEDAPGVSMNDVTFTKGTLAIQAYQELFGRTSVAARAMVAGISGSDLPIHVLLPIGGGSTLRGYPQDRLLDRISGLVNVEFRFPIIWRFWGIAGIDAGQVWHDTRSVSLGQWKANGVIGLRFKMDLFIVRMDLGFSDETTGFYLNFGQLF